MSTTELLANVRQELKEFAKKTSDMLLEHFKKEGGENEILLEFRRNKKSEKPSLVLRIGEVETRIRQNPFICDCEEW